MQCELILMGIDRVLKSDFDTKEKKKNKKCYDMTDLSFYV